jgi:hypothetical protein
MRDVFGSSRLCSQSATLIDGHLAKKYRHTFYFAAYRGLCPELDLGDASDVRVFRNDSATKGSTGSLLDWRIPFTKLRVPWLDTKK